VHTTSAPCGPMPMRPTAQCPMPMHRRHRHRRPQTGGSRSDSDPCCWRSAVRGRGPRSTAVAGPAGPGAAPGGICNGTGGRRGRELELGAVFTFLNALQSNNTD
jgi:hypothetical protein